jgi:acyl carrier protein
MASIDRAEVYAALREYVARELLHGKDDGLDENTPLLEWGIIDSLGMVGLLTFIEERWKVSIPDTQINPEFFKNLSALTGLVLQSKT